MSSADSNLLRGMGKSPAFFVLFNKKLPFLKHQPT